MCSIHGDVSDAHFTVEYIDRSQNPPVHCFKKYCTACVTAVLDTMAANGVLGTISTS
jgi:hypothetical protein